VNINEFKRFKDNNLYIHISSLIYTFDRTLLYGYCYDDIFHVYLRNNLFYISWYNTEGFIDVECVHGRKSLYVSECSSDVHDGEEHIYLNPECCDYEFVCLLRLNGGRMLFTEYNKDRNMVVEFFGDIL